MRNKFYPYFVIFCHILFVQQFITYAQQTQAGVTLKEIGVVVSFKTEMRDEKNSSIGGLFDTYVFRENPNIVHRLLIDERSGLYFGYDFEINQNKGEGAFEISIKRLSIKPEKLVNLGKYSSNPLPKYPDLLVLKEGETLSLSLLENTQEKVRIVDLIKIVRRNITSSQTVITGRNSSSTDEARDLIPEAIELRLSNSQLYINNKEIPNSARENYTAGAGEALYLYIPGQGRFMFSLIARPNYEFKKTGIIENNEISFASDNINYRIISELPILELKGKWSIWVFHDPGYKPKGNLPSYRNYEIGTAILKK